jgi:hypothetical protein
MNTAFKSMSDLIADSEDLLLRIGRSNIPQVRALEEPVRLAAEQLKHQFRERAKRLSGRARVSLAAARIPYAHVAAAALLAAGGLVLLLHVRRRTS